MNKSIIVFLIFALPFTGYAQNLHLLISAGVSNYQGDLQAKVFTFKGSEPAAGAGLAYDISNHFAIRGLVSKAKVSGNDRLNTAGKGTEQRNLNFKTNIIEGQLGVEYNLLDISEWGFTPYLFLSGAVYHFDPYTQDAAGQKIPLQPLGTEGQDLPQYPDKKKYKLTQFAIPLGGGVKLALTDNLQVGFEFGFRKLFHDYLDDVSTTYADSAILLAARGPEAVELAYRGDELPGGFAYPNAGEQRGNSKLMDWYYMTGFRIAYRLGAGNGGNRNKGGRKSRTGCPSNVY
ncbi:MAG: DUF6089 family protein [Ferruginibacter sp.]